MPVDRRAGGWQGGWQGGSGVQESSAGGSLDTAWADAVEALSDRESSWIEMSGPFGTGRDWYRAIACGLLPARFEGLGETPAAALRDLAHHLWTARPAIQEWQTTFTRLEPDNTWTDTFAPRYDTLPGTFERVDDPQ